MFSPRTWLRLEAAGVAATAAIAFYFFEGEWKWFGIFFLAPDVAMLGYLGGSRAGATCYNLAHNYVLPLAAGAACVLWRAEWMPAVCIWVAHIGVDRLLGFGLKYPDGFRDQHMGRV